MKSAPVMTETTYFNYTPEIYLLWFNHNKPTE